MSEKLRGHYLGGGAVSCSLVTKDSILATVKCSLLSYSLKNGALTHVQSLGDSEITGLAQSQKNSHQLLVSSRDGHVSVWDTTDWTLMKRVSVGESVSRLLVPSTGGSFFAITRATEGGKVLTRIRKFNSVTLSHEMDILLIKKECGNFAVSPCGLFVIFTRETRVRVVNTTTCATFTRYEHDQIFVSSTVHPSMPIAALGDTEGRVCILKNWTTKGEDAVEKHHWHANALPALSFAPNSEVLFTGGAESVLVKWLDGEAQFLPRIGTAITHLHATQDRVVIVTDDSVMHVVKLNTWSIQFSIANILRRSDVAEEGFSRDVFPVGEDGVIFSGTHGQLQIFDSKNRCNRGLVDVTHQNKVTGREKNKKLSYIDVQHFKVSSDGSWMVTVERRDDGFITPECRLKFWTQDASSTWIQEGCIDSPHNNTVTSLCLGHTTGRTALTTSTDKQVKVWVNEGTGWAMSHTLTHRHGPAFCAALSSDGSLAAVAYKGLITLYSTVDWQERGEISVSVSRSDQMILSGYNLLIRADDLLSCWDLTTLSLVWEATSPITFILPLEQRNFLAFSLRQNRLTDVFVFSPKSPEPLYIHKFVCPGSVRGACVTGAGDVIMATGEQELYSLATTPPLPLALTLPEEDVVPTVFSELLKITHPGPPAAPVAIQIGVRASKARAILDVSSSAMPPLSSICIKVLEDFLPG